MKLETRTTGKLLGFASECSPDAGSFPRCFSAVQIHQQYLDDASLSSICKGEQLRQFAWNQADWDLSVSQVHRRAASTFRLGAHINSVEVSLMS